MKYEKRCYMRDRGVDKRGYVWVKVSGETREESLDSGVRWWGPG